LRRLDAKRRVVRRQSNVVARVDQSMAERRKRRVSPSAPKVTATNFIDGSVWRHRPLGRCRETCDYGLVYKILARPAADHDKAAKVQAMSTDPWNLDRFVSAQAGVLNVALAELRAGRKRTHWMWFIFPQLRGLGSSPTARFYGLASVAEASAYLDHPVLGPRLEEAVAAVQSCPGASLHAILGSPDDLKFRSSMTLFSVAGPDGPYQAALDRWCDDGPDQATLDLLRRGREGDL
jgi:uncharacterized protein (DUF1810 family)